MLNAIIISHLYNSQLKGSTALLLLMLYHETRQFHNTGQLQATKNSEAKKKETEKENSASFELVSNHQPRWSKQMQLHKLESW